MLYVLILLLCLLPGSASAHMTIHYDGSTPVPVHVKQGSAVQVNFSAPITGKGGAVATKDIELTEDPWHPHRLLIKAANPPQEVMLHVNTQSGKQYLLQVTRVEKHPSDILTVIDGPPPTAAATASSMPIPESSLAPEDQLIRHVWETQWAGDPRLARPGVTMMPVKVVLLDTETEHREVIWAYTTRGYYGFTQRITNKSVQPKMVFIPSLTDPYARLFSANLDKHAPPHRAGEQAHVLNPGQSVLLHLVYAEVR